MNGGSRHAVAHQERVPQERLTGLLEPVISAAGFELESVRLGRAGRRGLLRVVVDGEHGVSTDDIAAVSRAVAKQIDASDVMGSGPYTLEVSSPGVDRPLTEPRHWRRAAGRLVRVPVAGDPLEGRVLTAGDTGVVLEIDGERREFGYAELGAGQVQVEFDSRGAGRGEPAGDGAGLAGEVEPGGH